MLKFLQNRDHQPIKRRKDIMRYESQSHLPNNRQFNSPLHQDALIQNDKPTYYITKKLPPIQIYNPLIQTIDSIERPEYIVKQKEIYVPRYSLFHFLKLFLNIIFFSIFTGNMQNQNTNRYFKIMSLQYLNEYKTKGFKKKQGIFESYSHLLAQNKPLIQGILTDKKPLSLPIIREHQKEQSILNIPALFSTRSQDRQVTEQSCSKSISQITFYYCNRPNDRISTKPNDIINKKISSQKQRISHKLLTEDKGIQVNFLKLQSHKILELSSDYTYNFNQVYQQNLEDEEEKEKQMRQLSIFDKKIKEFKEQQKQKLQKKEVS